MLENISKNRILIYIMLAGLLPFLFVTINFLTKQSAVDELETTLNHVHDKAFAREKKQSTNMAVRNHYRDADHFYIDKYLETMSFLEPEIESLQKIVNSKNYVDDDIIKKRLEFLTGPGNNMIFTEGIVQSYPLFQETTETLVHPVEVNVANLQELLARIEGVDIGPYSPAPNRPQLITLDFKIERKNSNEKSEVFSLNLKLLKREFL